MPAKRAPRISVLVVDDHRTFAEALALAVGLEKDLASDVVASGTEAVQAARRIRPDVVLMDVVMPGMDGVETIRRILEAHPPARVIVVSAYDDDLIKARALEAGAVSFVSKAAPLAELPDLVRRAHRHDQLVDPEEVRRLLRLLRHRRHQESTERQRAGRLTDRQTEILQMMADGVPVPEIARLLSVTPYTLRTHVQNILTRLGVHTKVEALAVAMRQGKIAHRA